MLLLTFWHPAIAQALAAMQWIREKREVEPARFTIKIMFENEVESEWKGDAVEDERSDRQACERDGMHVEMGSV